VLGLSAGCFVQSALGGWTDVICLSLSLCKLLPLGDIGDEHHLIFRCSAVQHIRDSYSGLFRANVQTMVQFMWQDDLVSVVKFVVQCLDFLQAGSSNQP
jgi:hypothetical protein